MKVKESKNYSEIGVCSMVRIAVVGTGWHGQGHLNTMKDMALIEIVGICDVNHEMLAKAANKFNVPAFDHYIQMLEETKPEGVVIVTPPKARVELVREAAIRGIHCFIEKPPAKILIWQNKLVTF
jgi:predicted dehydrogenase